MFAHLCDSGEGSFRSVSKDTIETLRGSVVEREESSDFDFGSREIDPAWCCWVSVICMFGIIIITTTTRIIIGYPETYCRRNGMCDSIWRCKGTVIMMFVE